MYKIFFTHIYVQTITPHFLYFSFFFLFIHDAVLQKTEKESHWITMTTKVMLLSDNFMHNELNFVELKALIVNVKHKKTSRLELTWMWQNMLQNRTTVN